MWNIETKCLPKRETNNCAENRNPTSKGNGPRVAPLYASNWNEKATLFTQTKADKGWH